MADSEKYFTKLVDGQLSVATVAQSGEIIPEESRPGEKYTTALVQTDDGPQLCVKTYDLNGGGKIPMARLPIVQCTQAEYDALVSGGTVDANTIYCIIPA